MCNRMMGDAEVGGGRTLFEAVAGQNYLAWAPDFPASLSTHCGEDDLAETVDSIVHGSFLQALEVSNGTD